MCGSKKNQVLDTQHFNGGPEMTKIWQEEFKRLVQLAECMIPNAFVGIWKDVPVSSPAVVVPWDHDLRAHADPSMSYPAERSHLEFKSRNAEFFDNGLDPWVGVWPTLLTGWTIPPSYPDAQALPAPQATAS